VSLHSKASASGPATSAGTLTQRDLVILVLLTLAWGINWPIMKMGVREMEPLTFRSLCMLGGLPLLALIIWKKGLSFRIGREHWKESFWIGMTNMVGWYVFAMYGVKWLSSGRAAILGYTMPIWVAIFGYFIFKDKTSSRLWVGVALASVGVLLLLGGELTAIAGKPLGAIFMLSAGAVWAIGTHLMKRGKQNTHVYVVTFWSLLLALILCGFVALTFERAGWQSWFPRVGDPLSSWNLPSLKAWFAVVFNAVVVFAFAQVAWFRLTLILTPVASGLSVMMIPVVGVFSGMLVLGETPHWNDYAALLMILGAMACVLWPQKK
jgi:drug/metabolite transporter (DMT)-like permease